MTKEDVLFMAQECHLIGMRPHLDGIYQESLEHFAALVAAAAKAKEREACAKVCDDLAELNRTSPTDSMWEQEECAAAIRARGVASIIGETK